MYQVNCCGIERIIDDLIFFVYFMLIHIWRISFAGLNKGCKTGKSLESGMLNTGGSHKGITKAGKTKKTINYIVACAFSGNKTGA